MLLQQTDDQNKQDTASNIDLQVANSSMSYMQQQPKCMTCLTVQEVIWLLQLPQRNMLPQVAQRFKTINQEFSLGDGHLAMSMTKAKVLMDDFEALSHDQLPPRHKGNKSGIVSSISCALSEPMASSLVL